MFFSDFNTGIKANSPFAPKDIYGRVMLPNIDVKDSVKFSNKSEYQNLKNKIIYADSREFVNRGTSVQERW